MPDNFTLYEGEAVAVDGSEGKSKRLLNVVGDDLYYRTDPHVDSRDTKLQPGDAVVITDRVWIITAGLATKVIVTPASEEI